MAKLHPGKFVWFELFTNDIEAAQRFYGEAFGWKNDTMRMGDGSDYPLIVAGEAGPVGGFRQPPPDAPVHWHSYVSVKDVDATVKKVKAKGGHVPMDAFDAPGVGRMAPAIDPQGGGLSLFTSEQDDPEERRGTGTFHWNELWADDAQAAKTYYQEVFGYDLDKMDMPQGEYVLLKTEDTTRGGILQKPDPKMPTMWLPYVEVDDADACAARAKKGGAELIFEPMETPGVGRHGILKDPTGGVIGFIQPASAD